MRVLDFMLLFVSVSALGSSAQAGSIDTDTARRARADGDIRPLSVLLAQIEAECSGRFVEVELDKEDGRSIYEIKLLGPEGDVAELEYDAHDLHLLEAEGQQLDRLGCVPPGTPD